jgi:hypothetical protein
LPGVGPAPGQLLGSSWTASMTCAGLLGIAIGHASDVKRAGKVNMMKDPQVKGGLAYLEAVINGKAPEGKPGQMYYFLWSLERMAVVYDAKKIGQTDWYTWGAKRLLDKQGGSGAWHGDYAEGGCDTCFALLFLKKVNVIEGTQEFMRLGFISDPAPKQQPKSEPKPEQKKDDGGGRIDLPKLIDDVKPIKKGAPPRRESRRFTPPVPYAWVSAARPRGALAGLAAVKES